MAPPIEPPEHITLRIKVPPGSIQDGADDYALPGPVAVTTSVGQLRNHIQQSLPSNPPPARQRLLYAGRALVDSEQTLADALNVRRDPTQTEYVVHLLVRNPSSGDARTASPAPGIALAPASAPATARAPAAAPTLPPGLPPALQQDLANVAERQQEVLRHQQDILHHMLEQQQRNLDTAQRRQVGGFYPDITMPQPHEQHGHAQPQQQQQQHGMPQVHTTAVPVPLPDQSTGEQPQNQHGHPAYRQVFVQGVGPNGERIAVHQQRVQFQYPGPNMQHLPPGAHGLPPGVHGMQPLGMQHTFPLPFQQQQQWQTPVRPALDRAREQIAELRRLLEEVRAENPPDQATPEQIARIDRMQEQTRNINNYIDPFHSSSTPGEGSPAQLPPRQNEVSPFPSGHINTNGNANPMNPSIRQNVPQGLRQRLRQFQPRPAARLPPPVRANPEDVACYLLSDPQGIPQAILLSPEHGTFTGRIPSPAHTTPPIAAVAAAAAPNNNAIANPFVPQNGAAGVPQAANARPVPGNNPLAAEVNPMGLLLRHFWLLFRIMIFAYFFLGSNMGWRRPLALAAIAGGFWLVRAGMLGDGGVARRWWEGIVREGAAAVQGHPPVAENANPAAPGAMPTPEEVARRLLEERRREGEWMRWARERVRPAERALALLIASLWPGVGEGFVRAREEEARRLAEEEIAEARRREEEAARVAAEEEEREKQSSDAVEGEQNATSASDPAGDEKSAAVETHAAAEQAATVEESSDLVASASATTD